MLWHTQARRKVCLPLPPMAACQSHPFGKFWVLSFFVKVRCFSLAPKGSLRKVCVFSVKVCCFFLAPKGSLRKVCIFSVKVRVFFSKYAFFLSKYAVFLPEYGPKAIPSGTFSLEVRCFSPEYGLFLPKCVVFSLSHKCLPTSHFPFHNDSIN